MLALSIEAGSLCLMKRYLWLLSALVMAICPAMAQESRAKAAQDPVYPEKHIKLESRGAGELELMLPIALYENAEGKKVEMFGALHVAELKYFDTLNACFAKCDVLLFEMIGGENLQRELELESKMDPTKPNYGLTPKEFEEWTALKKAQEEALGSTSPMMLLVGVSYVAMSELLGLEVQNNGIDYSPAHFVHADMTMEEFKKAQEEKGENMLTMALKSSAKSSMSAKKTYESDDIGLALSVISGNKRKLKNEFMRMLAYGDDEDMEDTVILASRNASCMKVFDQTVQNSDARHIGIFYGAAHMPELHQELLKRGYQLKNVRWIPACSTVGEKKKKN